MERREIRKGLQRYDLCAPGVSAVKIIHKSWHVEPSFTCDMMLIPLIGLFKKYSDSDGGWKTPLNMRLYYAILKIPTPLTCPRRYAHDH